VEAILARNVVVIPSAMYPFPDMAVAVDKPREGVAQDLEAVQALVLSRRDPTNFESRPFENVYGRIRIPERERERMAT